jgi:hypothetical protein
VLAVQAVVVHAGVVPAVPAVPAPAMLQAVPLPCTPAVLAVLPVLAVQALPLPCTPAVLAVLAVLAVQAVPLPCTPDRRSTPRRRGFPSAGAPAQRCNAHCVHASMYVCVLYGIVYSM